MTPEAYLGRPRALLPSVRQLASYVEQPRRLPDQTSKEFREAGLFRTLQPKRYGNYESDV
jgi:3-hydroxy-9,10-secoandrosta-1,3,5(10)-triene-9,17-dione monooxygenase